MPRRISAEIDMQILADLGVGQLHKDIATKYGVSPSYVSKLALGKKVPDIHIIKTDAVENIKWPVDQVIKFVDSLSVFSTKEASIDYLEKQIQLTVLRLKLYVDMLNKLKEDH